MQRILVRYMIRLLVPDSAAQTAATQYSGTGQPSLLPMGTQLLRYRYSLVHKAGYRGKKLL